MKYIKISYLLLFFLLISNLCASQSRHKRSSGKAGSLKQLIANVNKHPNSLPAHIKYIQLAKLARLDDSALQKQYKIWMQRFPNSINIPFAIGTNYFYQHERQEAAYFLLKAVDIDSSRADIWDMLSTTAVIEGNSVKRNEYAKKASLLKPDDAGYAFYYASSFKDIDTAKYSNAMFEIVKRFPGNIRGAQALYLLAQNSKDTLNKISILQTLYTQYGLKNTWSSQAVNDLYDLYLQTNPEKALPICDKYNWKARRTQAEQIVAINGFIA